MSRNGMVQDEDETGVSSFKLQEKSRHSYNENDPILLDKDVNAKEVTNNDQVTNKNYVHLPTHGLSVLTCALFIVGEMASGGILALPRALVNADYSGIILMIACAFAALYCGVLIGKCWMQLRSRADMEEAFPRDPYPTIGYECYGRAGRAVVEFCLLTTLIGAGIVFLIVSAQNIASIVDKKIGSFESPEAEARAWVLIISAFVLPCTYLGTPKDIWPFAVLATVSTSTACILIVVKCIIDWPGDFDKVPKFEVTVESFFRAFGTIAFAFGGTSLFPSYQADMKKPEKFTKSAVSAFVVILTIYIPTGILPFLVYGAKNDDNILQTVKHQGGIGPEQSIAIAAEVFVSLHLLFALIIVLNPAFQQIEEYLKLPNHFGWKRCMCRTVIFLFVLGVAVAVPKFGVILSLVGGSTITMMTYVLPCVFYWKLNPGLPLYVKILLTEIIFISICSGGASTYSAVLELKQTFLSY